MGEQTVRTSDPDVVLVEALGYRPAWEALRAAGAVLEPIAVDAGGIDVEAVRARCRRGGVRAVRTSRRSYNGATRERVWEVSERLDAQAQVDLILP